MQKISDEKLLKLRDDDLIIENYYIDMYYSEAKLKSGLYVYWVGSSESSYGRSKFLFNGSVKNLIVMEKSYEKTVSTKEEIFIFTNEYLNYCDETKKLVINHPKYLQMEKIAKNIIEKSRAKILFYELEDYVNSLLNKYELEIMRILPSHESMKASLKKLKARKESNDNCDINSQEMDL